MATPTPSGQPLRNRPLEIAVVTSGAVLVVVVLLVVYVLGNLGLGPSNFSPSGQAERASPGTLGCRALAANVCYVAGFTSALQGLHYSALFFGLTPTANASHYPAGRETPLPSGATVSVLDGTAVLGVWSYDSGTWLSTPTGLVPQGTNVPVVLDSGYTTNTSLVNSTLWVEVPSPYSGMVGFPLH